MSKRYLTGAMAALLHGADFGGRYVPPKAELARDRCAKCDCKIPPGRPGRKCVACRADAATRKEGG
jgi:hypothetical protein